MRPLTCLAGAGAAGGFVLGAVFAVEEADSSEELGVEAALLFLTIHDLVENLVGLGEEAVVLGEERLDLGIPPLALLATPFA
jgi:hypothetical protein